MSFSIKFLDKPVPDKWLLPSEQGELARVTINDFIEEETVLTDYWTKEQYVAQWLHAIENITQGSSEKAALATAVHNPLNPQHGYVVHWWTLYRQGDRIFIRNASIPYEEGMEPVNLDRLYDYVPNRDENEKVSEWEIAVEDLKEFESYLQGLRKSSSSL